MIKFIIVSKQTVLNSNPVFDACLNMVFFRGMINASMHEKITVYLTLTCWFCSFQVWSTKCNHISSQCLLATKPPELRNMRPEKGHEVGNCDTRRRGGLQVFAEKATAASLLCLRWAQWLSLHEWNHEVLCDANIPLV